MLCSMKLRARKKLQKRPRRSRRVKFGVLAGKVVAPADFDAPLPPDVQASFETRHRRPFGGRG
jgi:hypothetical protein